jgi:hypothetical protein
VGTTQAGKGLGNLARKHGVAPCGPCYVPLDNGKFPIAKAMDEDGVIVEDNCNECRYKQARNGDNLLTPFQCDICQFRNLMG